MKHSTCNLSHKICMKITLFIFITIALSTSWHSSLSAFDIPVRYHAPASQGRPARSVENWVASPTIRYRSGHSSSAYDGHAHKTSLFNGHGPTNIASLGIGVAKKGPRTEHYWPNDELFLNNNPATPATSTVPPVTFGDFACNQPCTGNIQWYGKYNIEELALIWRQNILWGLFAHLFMPIKKVSLSCISYQYCSNDVTKRNNEIINFLENDLNTVLAENDLKPYNTRYCHTGIADPVLSFGWQGQTTENLGIIDELKGMVMAGVLFPCGKKKALDQVFSLPMGYNDHWGFNLRLHVQASLWSMVIIGVSGGVLSLLSSTSRIRVKTDKRQNGWIMLEKTEANQDSGAVWDLEGYVGIDSKEYGVLGSLGFSFVRQENERLSSRDACFLDTLRKKLPANSTEFISSNDVLNSQKQLRSWETFVFHLQAGYDASAVIKSSFAPTIQFFYDLPFSGKYTFATEMFGGAAGITCSFAF